MGVHTLTIVIVGRALISRCDSSVLLIHIAWRSTEARMHKRFELEFLIFLVRPSKYPKKETVWVASMSE